MEMKMNQAQNEFLEKLKVLLQDQYEISRTDTGLLMILPGLGMQEEGVAAELMFYPHVSEVEDDRSGVLQIYITVCNYREENAVQTTLRLEELTKRANVGHFGLYHDASIIYYRYCVTLADIESRYALQTVCVALANMSELLNYLYDYIVIMGDDVNAMTLEEYDEGMDELITFMQEDPDFLDKLRQEEE
ncbi:MAG: hypothetical protein IJ512_03605 [Ruminococcus sp.]|nr:hypothetical protein [Ruminococcus sp.]